MCLGGDGGGAQTQTVYQNAIPEWAKPYAMQILGQAQNLTFSPDQGYKTYGGQRIAGLNPLQQQGIMGAQALGPTAQTTDASTMAQQAGAGADKFSGYQPMQYQPMGVSYLGAQAPMLQQYKMDPAQQVGADQFNQQVAQQYMSPYTQSVINQQKLGAIQDYARNIPGLQAQGIRAGARGGTREALLQSEAKRGLMGQLGGIEASGRQQAFQNAQQQFGADRAAAMQAALANQQAGLTVGQQNLAAQLGTQQLGTQTGLQAALANQQAQLQAQQQGLSQNQAAQAAQEQSRQFGANLGLQGLQQKLGAAQVLGGLGQQQFNQQQAALEAQQKAGTQMQSLEQQRLDQMYQDFVNQQKYPYTQIGFFSDILRGTPSATATSTFYQAPPSALNTVAGLGSLAYGLGMGKGG